MLEQSTEVYSKIVGKEGYNMELKEFLSKHMDISSRETTRLKKSGGIFVNGEEQNVRVKLRKGDLVKVVFNMEKNIFEPEEIEVEVLYEDEDVMAVYKNPYQVVHTTKKHKSGTIANGIAYMYQKRGINYKIRFINRLDRDTSGILLVGKNSFGQMFLSKQMIEKTIKKKYYAIVENVVEKDEFTIDLPIGRESEDEVKRKVFDGGQSSVTHVKVVKRFKDASLVEIDLETGRTHQIRVHMSHIGHPLIGDPLYGNKSEIIDRQALHSYYIKFNRTRTYEEVELSTHLPDDMKRLVEYLDGE